VGGKKKKTRPILVGGSITYDPRNPIGQREPTPFIRSYSIATIANTEEKIEIVIHCRRRDSK